MADLIRHDLVEGDAGVNISARRFLYANAGEESTAGASVIAGAVGSWRRVHVVHAAEDLQLMLHLRERFHRAGELEILAFALGPPVRLDRAVRKIDERHAQRRARRRGGGFGRTGFGSNRSEGPHRLEGRQRKARAEAAQKMAAVQARET